MASKIRLADNTEYGAVWCGAADGVLNIELTSPLSMVTAATVFSDAVKTASIVYLIDGTAVATYGNYSTLLDIHKDRWNGRVMIQLEKTAVTDMIELLELEILETEEE